MAAMKTRTGGFGIGFRRGWSEWQKDLAGLVAWAKEKGFAGMDLGQDAATAAGTVSAAGLVIGSADLLAWKELLSADAGKRAEAVARNAEHVPACAKLGVRNFFAVMLPEKPELPRKENFGYLVSAMGELAPVLERAGATLVIEGWPGPGALCCNPETCRALFREVPSSAMGLNYDPSHLIRMGIDPLRFLREFKDRVHHVHAKDCEILDQGLYEVGREQEGVFTAKRRFGGFAWRYTIPGRGVMQWGEAFAILKEAGYRGMVSIELEDENFNTDMAGEQEGLMLSAQFLTGC